MRSAASPPIFPLPFPPHTCSPRPHSRVADTDALALDDVDAVGEDGEQQVGNAVVKQVDLIHVQDAAVGLREQA